MEEEAIEMAALGTERFSASVGLWKKRLELHIAREEPVKQLQKLLKQAQIAVSAKVCGNPYNCCSNYLWNMVIHRKLRLTCMMT